MTNTSPFQNAYFQRLDDFPIIVCRECQHGVWPSQIEGHLRRAHRHITPAIRSQLGDEIRRWPQIAIDPIELEIPLTRTQAIPQLVGPIDGWQCQLSPGSCSYTCPSIVTMRLHWSKEHGWSRASHRGQPTQSAMQTIQELQDQACRPVQCQRLFPRKAGSQYFAIIDNQESSDPSSTTPGSIFWEKATQQYAQYEQQATERIQLGHVDEANPWLRRTGWVLYLNSFSSHQLLEYIQMPAVNDSMDHTHVLNPDEHAIQAIWMAMGELGRVSQQSIIHTGVFVRLEAIRTERHQTRYQPLEAYQDSETMKERVRPWQQMLIFFWRTQQGASDQTHPRYRFTPRQQAAWDQLVQVARPQIQSRTPSRSLTLTMALRPPRDTTPSPISSESSGSEDKSSTDHDQTDDHMFDDSERDSELDPTAEGSRSPLTAIQQACLEFCIELLNQRVVQQEYDCALVCALAVLGVRERGGWRTPEDYPPILSKVIKLARFMVVQRAMGLADMDQDAEPTSSMQEQDWDRTDRGYLSPSPTTSQKGCLQWVTQMMDRFMIRGSQGPMQWMLDLRTYGLKIHYNTTTEGHVTWQHEDELLYKDVKFTMRQFRGMVDYTVRDAKRMLMEDLLQCTPDQVPMIPWDRLYDNPFNEDPQWSFLQDIRTSWPVDGTRWLWQQIQGHPRLYNRFMQQDGQGIQAVRWQAFHRQVAAFLEKLLAAVQFTWGQPARAPELLSIRHENSYNGGIRNMFIEDGMVVLVARYHKGYQVSGDVKIIHRYLPQEVGELLVWYLWLVLPFQRRIDALLHQREEINPHIWTSAPWESTWTSERVRRIFQRESRVGLSGVTLNIASYREIAIAISRRYMRAGRAFMSHDSHSTAEDDAHEDEAQIMARIADEQAGHSSHIAGAIYARETTERAGEVADRRQRFRQISQEWHQFLGFASAIQSIANTTITPFQDTAQGSQMERWTRTQAMDVDRSLQQMMGPSAVFRESQRAIIQSIVQRQSPIVAIMPTGAGKSLLFMLPAWMSRGGTTIVVVPLVALRADLQQRCQTLGISCVEWDSRRPVDGASVVLVTPESALSETFQIFLNRTQWTRELDRIVIDECHIILQEGYDFRKQMAQLGALVHAETQLVLLTATLPRESEALLCQRMHLDSHTIQWFRRRTSRSNVAYHVIEIGAREPVHTVSEQMIQWIQQRVRQVAMGKVVIYANTVATVQQIAHALSCPAFSSRAVDKPGMLASFRKQNPGLIVATSALGTGIDIPDIRLVIHVGRVRSLLEYGQESGRAGRDGGDSQVIMLIDGHGRGWGDAPTVDSRVEEYIAGGCRRQVLDAYLDGTVDGYTRQQCEPGEAICDQCSRLMSSDPARPDARPTASPIPHPNDDHSTIPIPSHAPHQPAISEHSLPPVAPRPVHHQFPPTAYYQAPVQRQRQHAEADAREIESIREQFDRWAGQCRLCEMMAQPTNHDLEDCPHPQASIVQSWAHRVIRQVVRQSRDARQSGYEPYAACFGCHCPQWICERWASNGHGGYQKMGRPCQYPHVAIQIMGQLLHGPRHHEIQAAWQRRMQEQSPAVNIDDEQQLIRHFQRRFGRRGEERSGLVVEMNWMCAFVARE